MRCWSRDGKNSALEFNTNFSIIVVLRTVNTYKDFNVRLYSWVEVNDAIEAVDGWCWIELDLNTRQSGSEVLKCTIPIEDCSDVDSSFVPTVGSYYRQSSISTLDDG